MWTPAEDWALETMCTQACVFNPEHLSLHFDAIKVAANSFGGDAAAFARELQNKVLTETGYDLRVAAKQNFFFLDMVQARADGHRQA
jgi:hypothetical protein